MSQDAERFLRAGVLFEACRELSPQEREEILSTAAAQEPKLHDYVCALLAEHDSRSGLFETSAAEAASGSGARPGTDVGAQIGPYRILEVLGEGGMGTVYLAEQKQPVRRRVAVKVIKLGMDTRQILHRFEAERQALAMMEHDSIARVLDAGATEDGRPYFAMEHVNGVPITRYCDDHKLDVTARLGLFGQVCAGVQHAHQKGVIHRDLKPGNILVTASGGEPKAKIIDFGLARATDHRLIEATLYTGQGVTIGTPEYMSPEQAGLGGLDVDTRTDVYSLGVVLSELLVGGLPFRSAELRQEDLREVQRVIREQAPTKPSTRITLLNGDGAAVAARRRTDTTSLRRRLRGDLDWIAMKALEKDRVRRYQTASELAADIRRHLDDEPVLAGPPAVGYRLRKFARRYRAQVAAAALVLACLVAGVIGTTWFALQVEARNVELEGVAYAAALRQVQDAVDTGRVRTTSAEQLEELEEARRGFAWDWLHARTRTAPLLFVPTDRPVRSVELNPDGARFLTVTPDRTHPDGPVRVYSTETRQELLVLGADARDAVFSPDGASILTGSVDGGAVVRWDAESGEPLARAKHGGQVRVVCFSRDGLLTATGGADGAVRLWRAADLREHQPVAALASYGDDVRALQFSPDGTRLLVAGHTGRARIHDVATERLVHELVFSRDRRRIRSACFSPDGELVLLGGEGGRVALWDAGDGRHVRDLTPHRQEFNTNWTTSGVAFGPNGRLAFSGGYDNLVRVHSVATGRTLGFLLGRGRLDSLCVGARGAQVIAGGRTRSSSGFFMWDLGDLPLPLELVGHTDKGSAVYDVATTADGRYLFSVNGYSVRKWDLATGMQVFAHRDRELHPRALDLRPDELHVAVVGTSGRGVILDASTGEVVEHFAAPPDAVASPVGAPDLEMGLVVLRYSPDGQTLAAGVGTWQVGRPDNHPVPVLLFDAETGKFLRSIEGHHKTVGALCFRPDGKRLVVCDYTKTMVLWNLDTHPPTQIYSMQLSASADAVAFDPSGERIYVPRSSYELSVFDAHTGALLDDYPLGHGLSVTDLDFDTKGQRLLVVRTTGVDVWNTPPRHRLLSLELGAFVWSGCFTPDDSGLVVGGDYGALACYEIEPRPDRLAERRTVYRAARWVRDSLADHPRVADVQAALRADLEIDDEVRAVAETILAGTSVHR